LLTTAWAGSSIPRNSEWVEPEDGVTILVGSSDIHTQIVMPLVALEHDWRAIFPMSDVLASQGPYTHVAVSWGEREFFLATPSWSEFDPLLAARAILGGEGALHVAYYVRPIPAENYREMTLRPGEYRKLTKSIADQLGSAERREVLSGYGEKDVFYTKRGTYHWGNTCNQWTSDRLAEAGVEIGLWTPLPGGVMKWVEKPASP
jgi:uncharacterized protein (TIGR02117 family)